MIYQLSLNNIPKEELYSAVALVLASLLISLAIFLGTNDFTPKVTNKSNALLEECGSGVELSDDCYQKFAEELKLDINEFKTCYEEREYDGVIEDEIRAATIAGVREPNTFFIAKQGLDKIRGFNLSIAPELEPLQKLVELLEDQSITEAQEFWFEYQLEELQNFRDGVREFLQSAEAGSLKGKELEDQLNTIVSERRRRIEDDLEIRDLDIEGGTVIGDSDVYLINFTDFECSFCSQYAQVSGKEINETLVDAGRITLVIRDYPVEGIHPQAKNAANAARCAGEQGKYLEYYNLLFRVDSI